MGGRVGWASFVLNRSLSFLLQSTSHIKESIICFDLQRESSLCCRPNFSQCDKAAAYSK